MALKKAKIIIYGENGRKKEEVNCMFNPSQYTIKSSANYKEDHSLGTDVSRMVFLSGNQKELSVSLFFDSIGEIGRGIPMEIGELSISPVTDQTKKITAAIQVAGNSHKPPMVAFEWGNLHFQGIITAITENFTMFDTFGKPIRAKMDITIKAAQEEEMTKKTEPFESPDRTKYCTVVEGMSLWGIAYMEYGDCGKWREIAKANDLKNPLRLYPGQVLKIPSL